METVRYDHISLVRGDINDFEFYYRLKCEESNIEWSGFIGKPDREKLFSWYKNNVLDKKYEFFIIKNNNMYVGALYFKFNSTESCEFLGIGVSEKEQGKGIAVFALKRFIEYIIKNYPSCKIITTLIREDNLKSQQAFKRAGFLFSGKIEYKYLSSIARKIKMQRFEIELN